MPVETAILLRRPTRRPLVLKGKLSDRGLPGEDEWFQQHQMFRRNLQPRQTYLGEASFSFFLSNCYSPLESALERRFLEPGREHVDTHGGIIGETQTVESLHGVTISARTKKIRYRSRRQTWINGELSQELGTVLE